MSIDTPIVADLAERGSAGSRSLTFLFSLPINEMKRGGVDAVALAGFTLPAGRQVARAVVEDVA